MSTFEIPAPRRPFLSRRERAGIGVACLLTVVSLIGWNAMQMSVSEPLIVRHVLLSPQSTVVGTTTTLGGGG